MARYVCSVCGYVHGDEEEGTRWDALPGDWTCPVCGAAKSEFQAMGSDSADAAEPGGGESRLPSRAVLAHRVFGCVFVAIYVVLLVQMVPRLWAYQIEFPARIYSNRPSGCAASKTAASSRNKRRKRSWSRRRSRAIMMPRSLGRHLYHEFGDFESHEDCACLAEGRTATCIQTNQ